MLAFNLADGQPAAVEFLLSVAFDRRATTHAGGLPLRPIGCWAQHLRRRALSVARRLTVFEAFEALATSESLAGGVGDVLAQRPRACDLPFLSPLGPARHEKRR